MPESFEEALKQDKYTEVAMFIKGPRSLPLNIKNSASQTPLMIVCQNKSYNILLCFLEQKKQKLRDTLSKKKRKITSTLLLKSISQLFFGN